LGIAIKFLEAYPSMRRGPNWERRVECKRKEKGVEENQNRDFSKHSNT